MPKRKRNAEQIAETMQVAEEVSAQPRPTVTVRYTGKGKCFVLGHLFDPDIPQSLVREVPVNLYESKLKPLGRFEIVL